MKLVILALVSLSLLACQKNNEPSLTSPDQIYVGASQAVSAKTHLLNEGVGLKTSMETSFSQRSINADQNSLVKKLCDYVKSDVLESEIRPFFSDLVPVTNYAQFLKRLASQGECEFKSITQKDFPFEFATYKVGSVGLVVMAAYDTSFKLLSFNMLPMWEDVEIQKHNVIARDGASLTTYVIQSVNPLKRKGVLLQRTPYMSYGTFLMESGVALNKGLVYVIQANRGTHTSTGEFKWLDPETNRNDAEDTLNWIEAQQLSTGKVVAYGVSYDGFNALATATTQHKSLASTIACSAPAHAATDSFTSGKSVEAGILPYISVGRQMLDRRAVLPYMQELSQTLFLGSNARESIDSTIVQKDLPEWNLINAAMDDQNHVYWKERSLYSLLETVKTPVLHIAGMNRDQDGRDTILAYQHLQKGFNENKNHFLALHPGGHGCGNFYSYRVFDKFLSLSFDEEQNLKEESQVLKPSARMQSYVSSEIYEQNLTEIQLKEDAFVKDLSFIDMENQEAEFAKVSTSQLVYSAQGEARVLNGMPTLDLVYESDTPEATVQVYLHVLNSFGQVKSVLFRTSFISEKGSHKVSLDLQPMYVGLESGDSVQLSFSTHPGMTFYRSPEVRQEMETSFEDKGVRISQNSILHLPFE